MPRNYIRKSKEKAYSHGDIEVAVLDIQGGMSLREAERIHGITRSVLQRFIEGGSRRIGSGRRPILGEEVEAQLENCLIARAEMGFPVIKTELKELIHEYILGMGSNISTPFVNGKPGDDWYLGFMKRHPRLSLKKPELMQKSRINARDPFVVFSFYERVKDLYSECGIHSGSSALVFNTDESGFGTDPTRVRAIGQKGSGLNRVCDGSGRESTTVLACISANGKTLPPLIVYKGLAVQPRWTSDQEYPETMYAATKNGWMEEPTFFMWFSKMFIPHVEKTRTELGMEEKFAILFFDGHSSHISLRIVKLAIDNNIKLVKFPSHLTDKIQPLDTCVFGPVKTDWAKLLIEHGKSRMGRGPCHMTKNEFATLIGQLWRTISEKNCQRGFIATGLFPLSTEVVKDDWFAAGDLARYRLHKRKESLHLSGSGDCGLTAPDKIIRNIEDSSDTPIDLTTTKRPVKLIEPQPGCSRDIVKVFSEAIVRAVEQQPKTAKNGGHRLKHHTMGEVLTSADVVTRLEEAEAKKGVKRVAEGVRLTKKQKK